MYLPFVFITFFFMLFQLYEAFSVPFRPSYLYLFLITIPLFVFFLEKTIKFLFEKSETKSKSKTNEKK